jgi:hypothetical protein
LQSVFSQSAELRAFFDKRHCWEWISLAMSYAGKSPIQRSISPSTRCWLRR